MYHSGVYSITNITNGKQYIGSSVNIPNRWKTHVRQLNNGKHKNSHLQNAWNKYGEDSFVFAEVIEVLRDKRLLLASEQQYIDALRPQYNVLPVAGSNLGYKYSDESKQRMSKAQIGNQNSLGAQRSVEFKLKLSEMKRGNKYCLGRAMSETHKDKLRTLFKGKIPSAQTIAAVKIANSGNKYSLGRKHTDEELEKMRLAKLGKKQSIEHIAARSASMRKTICIRGENTDTNESVEFTTFAQAISAGFTREGIANAVKKRCRHKGFYWTRTL